MPQPFAKALPIDDACAVFREREREHTTATHLELDGETESLIELADQIALQANFLANRARSLTSGRMTEVSRGAYTTRLPKSFDRADIAETIAESAFGDIAGYGVIQARLKFIYDNLN